MAVRPILLLGNPVLYSSSTPLHKDEMLDSLPLLADLRDTLLDFRDRRGSARAIAAPQLGVMKRLIYLHEPGTPRFLANPVLQVSGPETLEVWENCMSFPELLILTRRCAACRVTYRDDRWIERVEFARGDLAVILQHECDHLDGILSVGRAVDGRSFCLAGQSGFLSRHARPVRADLRT